MRTQCPDCGGVGKAAKARVAIAADQLIDARTFEICTTCEGDGWLDFS